MSKHNLHDLSMFTAAVKYGRTAEFKADERSSITHRFRRGGVQSVATDQKGRGAMTERSVVEHAHTTHPADVECAASATAETDQPSEFVTITVTRNLAAWWASWVPLVESNFFERQIQAACRAALKEQR